ncbi:hypothetical protein [Enterococcus phage vB_EfaS_EF1c55]|nr:hypothetical protein [Enterococcus phage vB_EfaS_EF1c55]
MEGIELDNYYNFLENGYLEGDQANIETTVYNLTGMLSANVSDVTEYEFEAVVEEVTEAIDNLTNSLEVLSELFTDAKRYLAKEDKKWEENV